MMPSPRYRLRLGCGEALGPVATTLLHRSAPPVQATWQPDRHMPRLPNGVLSRR